MKTTFDLVEAINDEASRFQQQYGHAPEAVALSPVLYRRLIELRCQEQSIGNLKVGIFGLTTPETNVLSQPAPVFVDTNIVETAAAMVDTLNTLGCDVVICLSHLGVALDQLVATYVPGIHIIVGGHDHYLLEEPIPVANPSGDTTWVVQANAFYLNIGKAELEVDNGRVRLVGYEMLHLDETVPEEPTTLAVVGELIAGIENLYGPVYSEPIGVAAAFFEEVSASLSDAGWKDTPVGNLVTDAFRAATGTEIAIQVGGSTAQPFYAGPLVAADAFRVVGYGFNTDNGLGYRIATFEMSGGALVTGLEFGLSSIELNDEFLVQVSGMRYTYDPAAPAFERVTSVTVGGEPLEPQRVYTVTANEFVPLFLEFLGIPHENVHVFPDTTEFQLLVAYIGASGTIAPSVEGRVESVRSTPTSVEDEGHAVPYEFTLEQNYPNPFNPSTTVVFSLPAAGHVTLKVYNILGQEIAALFDGQLPAGRHAIVFDAAGLPSGVYLYQVRSSGKVRTRSMVLMK
ncbi:MAG: 5'-nucleotidase C-terminal domain-containing protein [Bacteroidota bacterium]